MAAAAIIALFCLFNPTELSTGRTQFNLGTWVRNADPVVSSATVANRVAVATCPRRVPSVLINVVFIMV